VLTYGHRGRAPLASPSTSMLAYGQRGLPCERADVGTAETQRRENEMDKASPKML